MDILKFSHICLGEIIGLKLQPKTTFKYSDFYITNDVDFIENQLFVKQEIFEPVFGSLDYEKIKNGSFICILLNQTEDLNYVQNFAADIISTLWRISDNSIYVNEFYYIPIQNGLSHYRGKLNYNMYKANGTIEYVEYSDKDFSLIIELYNKRKNFISIPNVNFPKENIDEVNLYVSHRMENHNDMTRFHRANRFLNEARKQSYLALKISNLIAFFECLFSIKNEDRIAHNISMRSSEFLFIYDKTILKDETYKTLKSSYDIRSKYVHGDKLKDAHSKIIDLQLYSVNLDNLARIVYNTILDNNLEIFNDNTNIKAYLESVHK